MLDLLILPKLTSFRRPRSWRSCSMPRSTWTRACGSSRTRLRTAPTSPTHTSSHSGKRQIHGCQMAIARFALHTGAIQGKEGIKFCYLATLAEITQNFGELSSHAHLTPSGKIIIVSSFPTKYFYYDLNNTVATKECWDRISAQGPPKFLNRIPRSSSPAHDTLWSSTSPR